MSEPAIFVNGQPFFGRVEEQKQFRITLAELGSTAPHEALPFVILLYGDGGIGKTSLARRFRDILHTEFPNQFQSLWIDWEDERRRTARLMVGREHIGVNELFDSLYAIAVRQGWEAQFAPYQQARTLRAEAEKRAIDVLSGAGERDELSELRTLSIASIARLLRHTAPLTEAVLYSFAKLGIKGELEDLARMQAAATNRLQARLEPDQLDMFLYPEERLAAAMAQGWRSIASQQPLVAFLDTYEIVDRADHLLRLVMQAAGSRLLWVIGGRDNLLRSRQFGDDYFKGYAEEWSRRLLSYDMHQLAREDIRAYFSAVVPERPLGQQELIAITRATRGIPLAVREAAEIWQKGQPLDAIVSAIDDSTPSRDIVRHMTERYHLHCMHSTADRQALYALALAHGDTEILRAMLAPANDSSWSLETTMRRLERDYASVHREPARLHDDPAAFFLEHLREPVRREEPWVKHYAQQATQISFRRMHNRQLKLAEEYCQDEDWVKAALDYLDYQFWLSENHAWCWLIPRYVESLEYSQELKQGLIRVAERWKGQLSKGGQKRLKILANTKDEQGLLEELSRLERHDWLGGIGDDERHAILSLRRGRLCTEQKHYEQAQQHYEQAERGLPEGGELLRERLGLAMHQLAGKLIWPTEGGDALFSAQAEQLLTKVVEWLPEEQSAWYRLGATLRLSGKLDQAIAAFQQAITLNPTDAAPHNGLGNTYRDQGHFDQAISAYQQAIALNPSYAVPHNSLGNVYAEQGRFEQAIPAFQQASALDPSSAAPHYGLGLVYTKQGRFDQAIAAFQQAIALDPTYINAYLNLGPLYYVIHEYESSIKTFQHVLSLQPDHVTAHNNTAYMYSFIGEVDKAKYHYQQALRVDPGFFWSLLGLARFAREEHDPDRQADYLRQAETQLKQDEDFYEQACFESVAGNVDDAIQYLEIALNNNERNQEWAQQDPAFRFICDDPRFKKLVGLE